MEVNNFLPIGEVAKGSPCSPKPTRVTTSKDAFELYRRDPRRGSAKPPRLNAPRYRAVGRGAIGALSTAQDTRQNCLGAAGVSGEGDSSVLARA